MCDKETKLREERLVNFQLCNDEIRFFKQQQWRVTYYCLLLMSAILFIVKKYPDAHLENHTWIIWIIPIAGTLLLADIEWSIYKHRNIINKMKEDFDSKIEEYEEITRKWDSKHINVLSHSIYIVLFIGTLWVAWWVVLCLIMVK